MAKTSLQAGTWSSVITCISAVLDIEATARQFGALTRVRKIKSAEGLLRLALMYGPGGQSLASAAALAGDAGIAQLTDKAVEGRLRKMGNWLEHILECLLSRRQADATAIVGGLSLALVDGSVICAPGGGGRWRLHARYDPGQGRFGDLRLTDEHCAEAVNRTAIIAGSTIIMDRGYARVRDFTAVLAAGSDFITRIGWRSLRLLSSDGQVFDPLEHLPPLDEASEHLVYIKGIERPLRLILQRLPAEAAASQRRKRHRKASKAGQRMDPRTDLAAGYLMLLTSLPQTRQQTSTVLSLYRSRWQVELGFKRLKSIGAINKLPAADPDIARAWLLAHLIAAVLTDDLANEIAGFSPSAAQTTADLALAHVAAGTSNPGDSYPAPTTHQI
jgi:hypothetical protein